jgi:hypothetical protein
VHPFQFIIHCDLNIRCSELLKGALN